ncbi:asparaginase domain-containing protein (plasmid) [Ensifer adhaerens]|uniref:asparaginase domain-containing protein n=1 Tax=Ensifer adhaerens TaxID=106592 RepID=UPI0023A9365B|nr:asparaginase domain-containing protein [Ensifer adhaerens]WDZ81476.1 asparaginase domain-containing protein [Ensifer adhaerens]
MNTGVDLTDLALTVRPDAEGTRTVGGRAAILLIHTGGTIGMRETEHGLAPSAGLLERAAKELASANTNITIESFAPLIDSADITHDHWNRIISGVQKWGGTGVIVTHGTDTMAFTGAALSQALVGLGIPVVLTGAMKPLGTGGDAENNLQLALEAVMRQPAGVWLAFGDRVLPAGGLVKHHTSDEDSFRPAMPVVPPVEAVGARYRHFKQARLAVITVTPGLRAETLSATLSTLDGAVLRLFGAGTIMTEGSVLLALRSAIAQGCRLRAVSQCEQGGLAPGAYAAGAGLWEIGVENGGEETVEAALVRLWLELSDAPVAMRNVRRSIEP